MKKRLVVEKVGKLSNDFFDGSISEIQDRLDKLASDLKKTYGVQEFKIEYEESFYLDESSFFTIYFRREKNDEEKLLDKERDEARERKEREDYERLKAKFG